MTRRGRTLLLALVRSLVPGAALAAAGLSAETPGPAAALDPATAATVQINPEPVPVTLLPLTSDTADGRPELPATAVLEVAIQGLEDLAGTQLVLVDGRTGAQAAVLLLTSYTSTPVALPVGDPVLEGHLELRDSSGMLARWPAQGEASTTTAVTARTDGAAASAEACLSSLSALSGRDAGSAIPALALDCDLHEAQLADLDLRGMDLSYRDLSRADLRRTSLDDSNLRGAILDGALLQGATMEGADLSGASLLAADLTGASLFVADLGGADLSLAVLRQTNLVNANLANARLGGADLTNANLAGALFSGADLTDAICPDGLPNRTSDPNSTTDNTTKKVCRQ